MRRRTLLVLPALTLGLWSSAGYCEDGPLGDPPPPALSDPSLAASVRFSPRLSTAGVAAVGPSLSTTSRIGRTPCASTNPCAMATPAIDHAIPARAN